MDFRSADVTRPSVIPWTSESNSFRAKALFPEQHNHCLSREEGGTLRDFRVLGGDRFEQAKGELVSGSDRA